MTLPNISALATLVIAQDAVYHTRDPIVFEQIKNFVWQQYTNADDPPIEWKPPIADVAGLGATIYAALIAAGNTAAIGGVAPILEAIGDIVLTYPYTRSSDGVLIVP